MNYRLRAQHKFLVEIDYKTLGKEELLIEEFMLMKKAWPSISWEIMVDMIVLIGNNQRILEAATEQFLYGVQRHDWWRG
jgi:hypothetical protein